MERLSNQLTHSYIAEIQDANPESSTLQLTVTTWKSGWANVHWVPLGQATVLRAISTKLTGPLPASWSLYITGENTNQYQVSSGECCNAGTPKIDILPGKVENFTRFTKPLHLTTPFPSSLSHAHGTTPDIKYPHPEQDWDSLDHCCSP